MRTAPVRQLAAIMFADIVGYSALMQRSEAEAVQSRDRFRSVLSRSVGGYGGEAVQHYGDGTLCVFGSAVQASGCALEIQRELRSTHRVPLRIGLHLGDIVRDEEGVYGDGVNIAARTQALAVPGSVLLTDRVADELKNHPGLPLVELGPHDLKNVERAVVLFALDDPALAVPAAVDVQHAPPARSVAVLPFVNMSADPAKEYFSDGITEEIINALAQLDGLKVTSRTSSFAFKNENRDVREIAGTLDVSHILEGSVRSSKNQVRVTAQLIDAESGFHLFSKTWDRGIEDVFVIQDEISAAIAGHLQEALGRVTESDSGGTTPEHAVDPEAYKLYLRGRHHYNTWSPEGALRSITLYRKALELDPGFPAAHAAIATSFGFLGAIGRLPTTNAYGEVHRAASRALELDPGSSEAEVGLGLAAVFYEWNGERAEKHFQRALALSPGSATVHHYYGMCCLILARPAPALAALETALDLDPLSAPINSILAHALAASGQTEQALARLEHTLGLAPAFRSAMEMEAMVHIARGEFEAALDAVDRYREHAPGPFAGAALLGYIQARSGDFSGALEQHQRLEERERVEPGTQLDLDFAILYMGLRKTEWALRRLEKAVEQRTATVVFLRSNPLWDELADHPRFKALLSRIGLWD